MPEEVLSSRVRREKAARKFAGPRRDGWSKGAVLEHGEASTSLLNKSETKVEMDEETTAGVWWGLKQSSQETDS